jgi:hypothetical protein
MSTEQQELKAAGEIVNLLEIAVYRLNKRDCGDDIVKARNLMTKHGLSLSKAFRLNLYGPDRPSTVEFEEPCVEQQEPEAQPEEKPEEETKPVDYSHPADYWVVPWAARLERILDDCPTLAGKDRRTILRVQRSDRRRDENDIIWLRDIVHNYKSVAPNELKIPAEYWDYIDSRTNNRATA